VLAFDGFHNDQRIDSLNGRIGCEIAVGQRFVLRHRGELESHDIVTVTRDIFAIENLRQTEHRPPESRMSIRRIPLKGHQCDDNQSITQNIRIDDGYVCDDGPITPESIDAPAAGRRRGRDTLSHFVARQLVVRLHYRENLFVYSVELLQYTPAVSRLGKAGEGSPKELSKFG